MLHLDHSQSPDAYHFNVSTFVQAFQRKVSGFSHIEDIVRSSTLISRESVNARVWPNPDPTQKPYYIPAKTKVVYSVFMMQKRTDLWGPDGKYFGTFA